MPKNIKGREIAEIIPDKCIACQLCIGECPISAIDMQGGAVRIDPEACAGCGRCLDVCPANAILFEKPVRKKMTGIGQKPHPLEGYRGIAVFIEAHDGTGAEVSWELVDRVSAPPKALSERRMPSWAPSARHSLRTDSAWGGPMEMTVTLPPYFSMSCTAASAATRSYGLQMDSTPERISVLVSGSILTWAVSGTCFMQQIMCIFNWR